MALFVTYMKAAGIVVLPFWWTAAGAVAAAAGRRAGSGRCSGGRGHGSSVFGSAAVAQEKQISRFTKISKM